MKKKFTEEQIAFALNQAEHGTSAVLSPQRWKKQRSG